MLLIAVACSSSPEVDESPEQLADVLEVSPSGERGAYSFAVTLRSPDTGCERYADWWEVVSEDDRRRDLETKRREYAQAGIPEYWIIDPERSRVVVLTLAGSRYRVHGEFTPGSRASSVLLPGLALEVSAVFAAAQTE